MVVFVIVRCGDLANMVYKIILGLPRYDVDFGAVDPVFSVMAFLIIPAMIVFQVGVKSISRLRAQGEDEKCRALVLNLVRIAAVA